VASGILVDRINVIGDFCHVDRSPELSDANSELFQQYFDLFGASSLIIEFDWEEPLPTIAIYFLFELSGKLSSNLSKGLSKLVILVGCRILVPPNLAIDLGPQYGGFEANFEPKRDVGP